MTRHTILTALTASFLAGESCAPERPPLGWAGSMDTLQSGTIRVRNPEQRLWDRENAWHIEEQLRIGSVDGGPSEFDRVLDLEIDRWHRIYVLLDREIRVFDRTGTLVRTIGRRGGGPGEFRAPTGLDIDSSGGIWVTDPRNQRYTVFDSSGVYRASWARYDGFSPYGRAADMDRLEIDAPAFDADVHATAPSVFETRYFKLDSALTPSDTIVVPWLNRTASIELRAGPVYAPRILSVLDRRGHVWWAVTTDYRIVQLAFSNDTVRTIERTFTPVEISGDEREALRREAERSAREIGLAVGGDLQIPRHKPVLARLVVDDRGYNWVIPYGAVDGETRSFDVFDPEGRYLGVADADFAIGLERTATATVWRGTPIVIRGDELYAVSFDELDVPYVVRARVWGRSTVSR